MNIHKHSSGTHSLTGIFVVKTLTQVFWVNFYLKIITFAMYYKRLYYCNGDVTFI